MKRYTIALLLGLATWLLLSAVTGCEREEVGDHGHDHGHNHEVAQVDDGHDHDHAAEGHDHGDEAASDPGHESEAEHDQEHDHDATAFIALDPSAVQNMDIVSQEVYPEERYDQIKIPGLVTVDPDRKFDISAPATVRIVKLDARVPAAVRPGERLAVLELVDPEIRNLQMDAVAARAQLLADSTEHRRNTRYLEGLLSGSSTATTEIERVSADIEVIEARLAAQQSSLDALLLALQTAGLSDMQLHALADSGLVATRLSIMVPTSLGVESFEVIDRPVHQGQTIQAGETLFKLVNLEQLWVVGEAFESDLAAVRQAAREQLPLSLLFPAEEHRVHGLRVISLEGEQDGANRITHFFVQLPNQRVIERFVDGQRYEDWAYRGGSRVQILVATERVGQRYVIPANAVVRQAGQAWIFVEEGGEFLRLPVAVESMGARQAVLPLSCGLQPGDKLVVRGALQLNLHLEQQQSPQAVDPHAGHSH